MIRVFLLLLLQINLPAPALQKINYDALLNPVEIRTLLQSSDGKAQSWGAWLAAQGQAKETIPLLQQIVERRLGSAERYKADPPLESALDALIQLSAKVPPSLISQMYSKRPAQALVLLSRIGEESNPLLLEWADRERDVAWFAAANLILERRLPQAAPLFLKGLTITGTLTVSDDGSVEAGRYELGTPLATNEQTQPAGYPPLALYSLVEENWPGNVVATRGPKTLYYMRNIGRPGETASGYEEGIGGPTNEDRLLYVHALAGMSGSVSLRAKEYRSIAWNGKEALESEVKNFRDDILSRYSGLLRLLVDRKRLTASEASNLPLPDLEIKIEDLHTTLE